MFYLKKSNAQGNGYPDYSQYRRWLSIGAIIVMSMLLLGTSFVGLNTSTSLAAAAHVTADPQKTANKLSFAPPTETLFQFGDEFISDLPVREINSLGSRDNTMSIAIGDLNADGLLDIVFGNGPKDSDPEVNRIFFNDPQDPGNFSNPDLLQDIGEPTKTSSVVLADLNGDGMLDIVFGNMGTTNEIFFNDGQGQFGQPQSFGTETSDTNGIAVGDVDGDGFLDIAVGNWGTLEAPEENRLYLNDGTGKFSMENSRVIGATPKPTASIALGDIDQHNGLDIIVGNTYAENELFFNDGAANFDNDDLLKIFGVDKDSNGRYDDNYNLNIVLGDINTDGILDIVSLNQFEDNLFITYLKFDDNGNIAPTLTEFIPFPLFLETAFDEKGLEYSFSPQVTDVTLADVNSDGWLDFVAGVGDSMAPDRSRVYFNPLVEQCVIEQLTLVDNLLESPDIFSFDVVTDELTLEEQELLFGPVENCGDEQNKVSFTDAMIFGAETSTSAVAAADLDNDGMLDIVEASWQGQISWVYSLETVGLFSTLDTFVNGTNIEAMATGDINNDGQTDIVATRINTTTHRTFINDLSSYGFAFFEEGVTFGEGDGGNSIALADMNNDGYLDIIISYLNAPNQVFYNDAAGLGQFGTDAGSIDFDTPARDPHDPDDPDELGEPLRPEKTQAFAIGDMDHKNGLDVVVANEGQNSVYLNDGSGGLTYAYGFGDPFLHTATVALGDFNQDGYLDVVVGNITAFGEAYLSPQPNLVYLNDTTGQLLPGIPFGEAAPTSNIAVGDFNGDSILDVAVGNDNAEQNGIYFGDGSGALIFDSVFGGRRGTLHLEAADLDADGDLDLIERIFGKIIAHINNGNGRFRSLAPIDTGYAAQAMALGDLNADGLPELIYGFSDYGSCGEYIGDYGCIHWNTTRLTNQPFSSSGGLPNNPPFIKPYRPWQTDTISAAETLTPQLQTRGFSIPQIFNNRFITVPYKLYDNEGDHVGRVEGYFSLDGGGSWLPAIPANVTDTLNLEATPWGAPYEFVWDTRQSGVFGQSDNVVLSLLAYPTPRTAAPVGTFTYTGTTAVSQQRPYALADTFPFRVVGTQIQVSQSGDEGNLEQAIVMHLPNGQIEGARPLSNARGEPFHPDSRGFLRGRGSVAISDTLFAMVPVTPTLPYSFTDNVSLFYTNGTATEETLRGHEVTDSGIQQLEVSADNPLLLFNLDVALEWDSTNDEAFMRDLDDSVRRASELLFDTTNGQAAIGTVRLFHNKQFWPLVDIVIEANNSIRPSAAIGGFTQRPISETVFVQNEDVSSTQIIPNAYANSQIKMGTVWDPYGENTTDLGTDWWQSLAHELAHYLLFLPDNYMGFKGDDKDAFGRINCQGSFMTSTYDPDYSEFLTAAEWRGQCLDSLAERTTGRTDWETIQTFYPMLNAPSSPMEGPRILPLDVTGLYSFGSGDTRTAVATRNFDVRDANNERVRLPNAQVYLFQTQGTQDPTDDMVIKLGAPTGGGDRLKVRGAFPGDRLCLFDHSGTQSYSGCVESLQPADVSIHVAPVAKIQEAGIQFSPITSNTMRMTITKSITDGLPIWQPAIQIQPVTSRTMQITVTQGISDNKPLNIQLYPSHYWSLPGFAGLSPTATMQTVNNITHTQTLTMRLPAYDVVLRTWVEGDTGRESINRFLLNPPWGVNDQAATGGPNNIGFGGPNNTISNAPISSADAQVVVYNQKGYFENNGIETMQMLEAVPKLAKTPWLVPAGQAYHISLDPNVTDTRIIAYTYLHRDVPEGYEHTLSLYFLPDGAEKWQRLETDRYVENLVVANLEGENGTYAVMAAVEMPPLNPGWNLFTYPIPGSRPITEALASLTTTYTVQEALPPFDIPTTNTNDDTVDSFDFGRIYWIWLDGNASMTPFLAPPIKLPDGTFTGQR